ncbi:MAG: type II toxin-antitoxin system VapC family toxin [Nitrospirota bacterium]
MILYCDTSALIKRYVEEDGTGSVDRLWDSALAIVTSTVAFAEAVSAFSRKLREGILTHKEYLVTVKNFKKDYNHLILVPINNDLNALIEDLAARHPLTGFDAIHLASAITFTQSENVEMVFACFDDTLNQSALKEGLRISFHY